jgi:hypothetical protein
MPKRFRLEVTRLPSAGGQTPLSFASKAEALRYLAERIKRDAVESALLEQAPGAKVLSRHFGLRIR